MKFNIFAIFLVLILLSTSVFAASPVITGPTNNYYTPTKFYQGIDRNYYDYPIQFTSGTVSDGDGDINYDSCEYTTIDGESPYWFGEGATPPAYWEAESQSCNMLVDPDWGLTNDVNFNFRVSDDVGHTTKGIPLHVYLDATAPTTTGTFDGMNTITLTAVDAATTAGIGSGVAFIYYSVDDEPWNSAAGSTTNIRIDSPGNHNIRFYSRDNLDHNEMRDGLPSPDPWDKPFTVEESSYRPGGIVCSMMDLLIFVLIAISLVLILLAAYSVVNGELDIGVIISMGTVVISLIIIVAVMYAVNAVMCVV